MSHALFAPSAAERWLHCGYSVKMTPLFIDTTTTASADGTEKHAIAAMHLENDTDSENPKLNTYLNAVRSSAVDGQLFVEYKTVIVPDLCEGTMDAAVLGDGWLHTFDLKYGKSPVHATENPQLMLYALGMVLEHQLPPDFDVRLTIVQPNASAGWPVKPWDTSVKALQKFHGKVLKAIDVGMGENPPAVAGSWCYWCRAKMHCKTYLMQRGRGQSGAVAKAMESHIRKEQAELRRIIEDD